MNRRWTTALAVVVGLLLVVGPAAADETEEKEEKKKWGYAGWDDGFKFESANGNFKMKIDTRLQFRFTHEDSDFFDTDNSFRVRRAKLKFEGTVYEFWKYKFQMNFARSAFPDVIDNLLEDAYVQYTKWHWTQPWVGQGKVPFGLQFMTSSGKQQFVDRSIATARYGGRRQIGTALVGNSKSKKFEYQAGIYNGNGLNQPADDNDDLQTVARVAWMPFGYMKMEESSLNYPDSSKLLIGVAYLDNSLGTIGAGDLVEFTRYNVELSYKIKGFNAVGEFFSEDATELGMPETTSEGWYVQAGYLFPGRHFEIALRQSEIDGDDILLEDLTETGIAFNYYIKKHKYKVQVDFRGLDSDLDPMEEINVARAQFQIQF